MNHSNIALIWPNSRNVNLFVVYCLVFANEFIYLFIFLYFIIICSVESTKGKARIKLLIEK